MGKTPFIDTLVSKMEEINDKGIEEAIANSPITTDDVISAIKVMRALGLTDIEKKLKNGIYREIRLKEQEKEMEFAKQSRELYRHRMAMREELRGK